MSKQQPSNEEFNKFDNVVKRILTVSHKELQERERNIKVPARRKSGLRSQPASRALGA